MARREAAVICFAWSQTPPVFLFLLHEATLHQRLLSVAEVAMFTPTSCVLTLRVKREQRPKAFASRAGKACVFDALVRPHGHISMLPRTVSTERSGDRQTMIPSPSFPADRRPSCCQRLETHLRQGSERCLQNKRQSAGGSNEASRPQCP